MPVWKTKHLNSQGESLMDNSLSISAAKSESVGLFTASNVAKCLGVKREDILEFLKLRGYITRDKRRSPTRKGDYIGTPLGIEKGYVSNYIFSNEKAQYVHFHLTQKGFEKVEKAFQIGYVSAAERKRIDEVCAEYEKNMRSTSLGKAE